MPDDDSTLPVKVTRRTKLWLGLGGFALLGPAGALAQPAPAAAPLTQGGEGGEGGEGGVDADRAATDPVAFILALDVVAAHYLAGRRAYEAGRHTAAAEMFAHPIAEIYAELEGVFQDRGVPPFQEKMQEASTLALDRAPRGRVSAAVDQVLAALKEAEAKAPGAGPSLPVRARVVGEMLDRAALQHSYALRSRELEPYLDGLGLYLAAEARAKAVAPALEAAGHRTQAQAMRETVRALAPAYPGMNRPAKPIAAGPLSAQAARLKLALSDLP
ncbi:hypothetical protein JYK14_23645 [Siccirubricoccus sp. KC 17139]|uniref:Lipoprotein n=1 Tax=Siccirubricoccus soli TaxID=2899147 RepID=A0ABT1DB28_9PROT|nr:hypothetical protein [Siccirubricoccus soli]MCO6419131.1 hypothetical protein [Siccirubricoccus soli]MCP2685266.1 hypothetical protein [Siccirubricoccus soli]